MSRRKTLAVREPSGKVKRAPPDLPSPTEVSRLRDAALSGLKDAIWGSMLGQVYLRGKISGVQFAAGKRWADLARNYSLACQSPKEARSGNLNPAGGEPADPDSPQGLREAQQQAHTKHQYIAANAILHHAGEPARRAVMATCEHGIAPIGHDGLENLKVGLSAIAAFWSERRR